MLGILFLISLGLLIISLLISSFIPQTGRVGRAVVFILFWLMLLFLIFMTLERFYGQQVSFLQPLWLTLLFLPILLATVRLYGKTTYSNKLSYSMTHILENQDSFSTLLARWSFTACSLLALTLFIIAMARPVTISRDKLPPTQGIDIMLILDASGSMNNKDFYPNRFVAAQKNAIEFIAKRFNDRIGLTLFAKNATLAAPLTLDHEAVQELIASLYLGIVNPDATAIGDAIGVAANHLKNSTAKSKIIVLLTDGSNNAGSLEPLLAAKAAAAYGIKIYTIATASPPGSSIFSSQQDEIDEGLLLNIAKETGGAFYRAKDEHELENIYEQINQLEKTDFTQTAQISRKDIYMPFLWIGLCLLAAGVILGKLLFIKVP